MSSVTTTTAVATPTITVVVLDGEIGAGKSEALGAVADSLRAHGRRVIVVPEPVAEWEEVGILAAFYADPAHRAYEFQTYTFVTRVQALREACCCEEDGADNSHLQPGDYVVMERSPMTDRFVFMELQRDVVGPMRMAMYEKWWGEWVRLLPKALQEARWVSIYLKPTIEACMDRLEQRARAGETVQQEYQQNLRSAHETFLQQGSLRCSSSSMLFSDVLVLEGPIADDDFRSGAARKRLGDAAAAFALRGGSVVSER